MRDLSNLEAVSFQLSFLSVRRTITKSTWAEIRTAYASGIGLREIARNMSIPEVRYSHAQSVKVGRDRLSPRRHLPSVRMGRLASLRLKR